MSVLSLFANFLSKELGVEMEKARAIVRPCPTCRYPHLPGVPHGGKRAGQKVAPTHKMDLEKNEGWRRPLESQAQTNARVHAETEARLQRRKAFMQTVPPEKKHLYTGTPESWRLHKSSVGKSLPDPKSHCKLCRWGSPHSGPAHAAEMRSVKKGGVGSGRHPKFGTPSSLRTAIGEYEREKTPVSHSRMVGAFRQHEAKTPSEFDAERVPWEKVKHPWDTQPTWWKRRKQP